MAKHCKSFARWVQDRKKKINMRKEIAILAPHSCGTARRYMQQAYSLLYTFQCLLNVPGEAVQPLFFSSATPPKDHMGCLRLTIIKIKCACCPQKMDALGRLKQNLLLQVFTLS